MGASVHRSERLKGARFGPYEIVRLLGHGATASVFEGKHTALGKLVAIKLLHEHLASDADVARRFVREGQVAAKLRHPNAIDVIDVGVEEGVPFLVMELLHGSDLRALIADTEHLAVEHALAFLLPIASALQHAHDAGVLHRDLKPANIFLARDVRDDFVPKLLDFGLSKAADGDAKALTRSELVAGTILYMAPEQTMGVRYASPASDQYSLAVVLYECLTGATPFPADGNVYEVIERVRTTRPRPPSAVRPGLGIPAPLDAAILRAMDRDPGARFESVRAFARALLPFADETTKRDLERDFLDRASGAEPLGSRPSLRRASGVEPTAAALETRAEIPEVSSALRPLVPLPCPPGKGPFHIKGLFYKGFLLHVGATVGVEPFLASLPDDALREFLKQPFLAAVRYDIFPFVPLSHALARKLGVRFDQYVRQTTAAQARYDATHVYKTIFDARKPDELAAKIARFNAQIYDFGQFAGYLTEPNHVVVDFRAIPKFIESWFGPMHVAYAEESLRIVGARDVTMLSHVVDDAGTKEGYPLVSFRTEIRWR